MPVRVYLCVCVSSPRTVNREIKDERVLWSSPPLAAQSGVLAKFPLWCRCGARLVLSQRHRDSGEVGVLSLAAGRRPVTCHAKPGTSTRGPEGSGGSKVSCPFSSSAFPLSLSLAVSLDLIRSRHGGLQEHPWLPVSGGGGRQEVDWRSGEAAAHTFTVRMSRGEYGADSQAKTTVT